MDYKEKNKDKGFLLGILILTLSVMLITFATFFTIKLDRTLHPGLGEIIGAFYIYYLGTLFLLSYFFEHKSFIFRWLMYICKYCSYPKEYGRGWAFIYFAMAFAFGTIALLAGLGITT